MASTTNGPTQSWNDNFGNGEWDEGEEFLDLIEDNMYTMLNSEYFYGQFWNHLLKIRDSNIGAPSFFC